MSSVQSADQRRIIGARMGQSHRRLLAFDQRSGPVDQDDHRQRQFHLVQGRQVAGRHLKPRISDDSHHRGVSRRPLAPNGQRQHHISVAADPASGLVMPIAGLSPSSTSPAARAYCAALP